MLRGPQGTLFGRNSPAGVVKLESAHPELGVTSAYFAIVGRHVQYGGRRGCGQSPDQ